jgi:hypothetical protein
VKEQVHNGLQDFVSHVLYGGAHEPGKSQELEQDHDLDKGIDR